MEILFIINKGRRDEGPAPELVKKFRSLLDDSGRDYCIRLCSSIAESEECITDALDSGAQQLWIGGGDGTINHALNFTFGRNIAYGIVPMGTVNALAQALGLPWIPFLP